MRAAGDDEQIGESTLDRVDGLVRNALREEGKAQPVNARPVLFDQAEMIVDGMKLIDENDVVVNEGSLFS